MTHKIKRCQCSELTTSTAYVSCFLPHNSLPPYPLTHLQHRGWLWPGDGQAIVQHVGDIHEGIFDLREPATHLVLPAVQEGQENHTGLAALHHYNVDRWHSCGGHLHRMQHIQYCIHFYMHVCMYVYSHYCIVLYCIALHCIVMYCIVKVLWIRPSTFPPPPST